MCDDIPGFDEIPPDDDDVIEPSLKGNEDD